MVLRINAGAVERLFAQNASKAKLFRTRADVARNAAKRKMKLSVRTSTFGLVAGKRFQSGESPCAKAKAGKPVSLSPKLNPPAFFEVPNGFSFLFFIETRMTDKPPLPKTLDREQ